MDPRNNPWWSPPAMQYVARFTGNPSDLCKVCRRQLSDQDMRHGYETCAQCAPGHVPEGSRYHENPSDLMPFLEWGTKTKGHGLLDYVGGYQGPPGTDFATNPCSSNPDCPECGSDMFKAGLPYRVGTGSGRTASVQVHVCEECGHEEHEDSPENNPSYHPGGGVRRGGNFYPGGGRAHHGGYHPGGGRQYHGEYYPGGGHYERNPEERHDVLCGCGWGRLAMPESEIPERCPVCNRPIGEGPPDDDYWHGAQVEQEDYDDPSWGAAYGDDWSNNPKYFTKGRGVARPFSRGALRRTMETDPMHESRMKGMLAHYGKKLFGLELTSSQIEGMLGKGRKGLGNSTATARHAVKKGMIRVGYREIPVGPIKKGQKVKLGDVKARVDAVFYAQSRRMGALEGVSISEDTIPAPAKKAKKAPKRKLPKKAKKKRVVANPVKTKKKRRPRAAPPLAQRCVKKNNNGSQCKGRKLPGQQVCVCHSSKSSMIGRKRA